MLDNYLEELTNLKNASISAALANFKQDNPNVDWRSLSNDDFNTQILLPASNIFGVDNEAKLKKAIEDDSKKRTTLVVAMEVPKKSKYFLDKAIPKTAPQELKDIYNSYQQQVDSYHKLKQEYNSTNDAETADAIGRQMTNAEESIRNTAFEFRRNPLNLTDEVMNDEFIKVGNKFKKAAKKYIPNINIELVPFYGDFTGVETTIKKAYDKGDKVETALNFHAGEYAGGIDTEEIYNKLNELGVSTTYCLSCHGEKQKDNINSSNYKGDVYIREGTSWYDIADNPKVVVKDKKGKVDEKATMINMMYSLIPNWDNGGTSYKQGGDYAKVQKFKRGGVVQSQSLLELIERYKTK